ncbi:DUF2278 family protein [Clostridiaceae bacterium UIB06]|uniref:DUF2278 family protein n=1 Tax=Clostridium thailandense TaxID=2794346 RepID=A0A949TVD4_9CLOT|nr:DUF2278 family protein [Clostridium thailandense]MBV7276027.1 DUF2278 family protein [Clostridium thailandense]MCH5137014.1 DUF2278 family protein [Clostridiaceae bacterium UIB06]
MAVSIYAICKARANTIFRIGCEVPRKEGKQILKENVFSTYEKTGGIFHYHFRIQAENLYIKNEKIHFYNNNVEVQVNVRSHEGRKTPKLEYLFKDNIKTENNKSFSLKKLSELDYGIKVFDLEERDNTIALDYIKSNIFYMNEFKSVPTTSDLNEDLHKYILQAKHKNADIYIFGEIYSVEPKESENRQERIRIIKEKGPRGIHDIHMNQGNSRKKEWIERNGEYRDGGVLIHFKLSKEDRWAGIFLRFEGQYKI